MYNIAKPPSNIQTTRTTTHSWLWLTIPVFVGVTVAAIPGFISLGTYATSLSLAAQGQGQDLITLVLVLPLLLLSAYWVRRGRLAGVLAWLGCMLYIAYTYAIAAFQIEFNALFLAYVLNLGCSFYGILWAVQDTAQQGIDIGKNTPIRATAIVMYFIALLFSMVWLNDVITAILQGVQPPAVITDNVPTSAVEVLDLGIYLPMLVIGATLLWRRQAMGVLLGGMALTFTVLMGVAIIAMIVNMARLALVDSVAQVTIFAPIVIIAGWCLWRMLQHVRFTQR